MHITFPAKGIYVGSLRGESGWIAMKTRGCDIHITDLTAATIMNLDLTLLLNF